MNKRLKIGIFLDSYYPIIDGVVMVTDNIACELAKYNDVTLIIPITSSYNEDYKKPYDIIRIKSVNVPFTEYKAGIPIKKSEEYKKILEKNFDVIHIHSPFILGKFGLKLAKKYNIPVFATVHSRYQIEIEKVVKSKILTQLCMKYIINIFNECDKCIVVNNYLTEEIREFGYKYEPLFITNGTDLTPLNEKEKNIKKVNNLYNLTEKDIVLLYVGRISTTKNVFFTLNSLKLLKQDNTRFKMLFVGSGPDDKKLKSKIGEYGLEDCVQMTGRIPDRELLSAIYARSDLLILPSNADVTPLVMIEAAVHETPGVYIEGTLVSAIITDNFNGFIEQENEIKFKNRIKEIINDKELLKKVSENAKETLVKTWETISRETYNEYLKAIEEKN